MQPPMRAFPTHARLQSWANRQFVGGQVPRRTLLRTRMSAVRRSAGFPARSNTPTDARFPINARVQFTICDSRAKAIKQV
jgi:hypothetical protein